MCSVLRFDSTPRIRAREKYLAPVHAKTCCGVTGGRRTFPEKRIRRVAEATRLSEELPEVALRRVAHFRERNVRRDAVELVVQVRRGVADADEGTGGRVLNADQRLVVEE